MSPKPKPTQATVEDIATTSQRSHHTILRSIRIHGIRPVATKTTKRGGRPRRLYRVSDVLAALPEPRATDSPAMLIERHRKLRIWNDTQERHLIPSAAVQKAFAGIRADTLPQLHRLLVQDYPERVASMTTDEARLCGRDAFDAACRILQAASIRHWNH